MNENLSDELRDFKKFTSKELTKAIKKNKYERRREWMLEVSQQAGSAKSRNQDYQFWCQDNQPQELYSGKFVFPKMNYIHQNPVEADIVERAEHYFYNSMSVRRCKLRTTMLTILAHHQNIYFLSKQNKG